MNFTFAQFITKQLKQKKIIIDKVDKMWGLGTPEDLDFFVKNKLSKK